jgi:RNA ligase (TIGR02306 family)
MALWKVIADHISILPHPNADRLVVGKIGKFQIVMGKDSAPNDGEIVIFAPERSILPEEIRKHYVNSETGVSFLHGSDHDRVTSVRLRNELSEGVSLDPAWVLSKLGLNSVEELPLNEDLSENLGIIRYVPPMPVEMHVKNMDDVYDAYFVKHDVDNYHTFGDEFVPGELADLTEKINGSQINLLREHGIFSVTSKGIGSNGLVIEKNDGNKYWQAIANSHLENILNSIFTNDETLQVVGEAIPFQGEKWSYGFKYPDVRVFKVIVDGKEVPISTIHSDSKYEKLKNIWTHYFGQIPFDPASFPEYANKREQISGKELHISEGIVITPIVPRKNSEGSALAIKWLNRKYKDNPDTIS